MITRCIMFNHLIITVDISISLLFFVVTPDLSESIDLKSSMNLEDWKLSNDLTSEINDCISHKIVLNVPDHSPFLLTFVFLFSLLLFEIGWLFLFHLSDLSNLFSLLILEFFDRFLWSGFILLQVKEALINFFDFLFKFVLGLVLVDVSLIKNLRSIFHPWQQDENVA
jgi:hypothetical protein